MSDKDDNTSGDKLRISEIMRELALSGLATYFMTEDTIKGYLKELKLPKEIVSLLLDGMSKKKDDFYGLLVKEFGRVLSKVDVSTEVSKFLESHRISVEAKVSFEPRTQVATKAASPKEPVS